MGVLAAVTALAVSAAVPVGLYHLTVLSSVPRRPASLRLDDRHGGFVVPAAPHFIGDFAIIVLWVAGGSLLTERVPGGDGIRLAEFDFAALTSALLVGLLFVVAVVLVLSDRPRVALDPDGLTVQLTTTRQRVSWDELAPGGPPPPAGRRANDLILQRAVAPGRRLRPVRIPVGSFQVDSAFFANVIRDYVEQPDERRHIGSEAGLARLHSRFGSQGR
ncbi:hypothetical protein ACGFI9_10165 [Micromonospora sp. NPDC048930]|uniref:hypothetical protein n=1 Tax=Micromonospora sp. NPDC048930 TaxID=3364261 RepID=UPI003718C881